MKSENLCFCILKIADVICRFSWQFLVTCDKERNMFVVNETPGGWVLVYFLHFSTHEVKTCQTDVVSERDSKSFCSTSGFFVKLHLLGKADV